MYRGEIQLTQIQKISNEFYKIRFNSPYMKVTGEIRLQVVSREISFTILRSLGTKDPFLTYFR